MLGQVVQLPDKKNNLDGMIFGSDTNIYYFTEFDHQGIFGIQLGAEVEFVNKTESNDDSITPIREDAPRKNKIFHTYVNITSCQNHSPNCVCGHIYITSERTPSNVSVYESIRNYEVCGESISREQALEEMIQTARSCGANAVLGVTLDLTFNPVKKFLLYRYYGTMAQIRSEPLNNEASDMDTSHSPTEEQPQEQSSTQGAYIATANAMEADTSAASEVQASSGSHYQGGKTASRPIQIAKSLIKKTSPNYSMKLKLQIILLGFLLLFIPLCGELILNYAHIVPRVVSFFFALVTCIMTFVIYINLNPHKNCGYVRKLK